MLKYLKSLFSPISISFMVFIFILAPILAKAQSSSVPSPATCVGEVPPYLAPANLAMMAYQGYFEKQGIPGYQVFEEQYRFGKITSAKIVQAAIQGCLLSDKYGVASDPDYVQDLTTQVRILIEENR